MEKEEMLEQTNQTENVDTQTTEENVEEVVEEVENTEETTEDVEEVETAEEKKSFKDFLKEHPEFQPELDKLMSNRIKRQEKSLRDEYDSKYSELNSVLKFGLGISTPQDAAATLKEYYKSKGKEIPNYQTEEFSNPQDIEKLAELDAQEIIECGLQDIIDETERLAQKGADKMTNREKLTFKKLATAREDLERKNELASINASKEIYSSKEFVDFQKKFDKTVSMKEIYEMYENLKPKTEVKPAGSMINNKAKEKKTFYTPDEAKKLTKSDLADPEVYKALENSMKSWK